MPLPVDGQLNWGDQLNAEITADETNITTVSNNYNNHAINVPADPHGDRAFASALVAPITTGVNAPNGYVKLDGTGHIPLSLVPVGAGLTNWVDVVPDYNVPTNGVTPADPTINAALFAAGQAGGGIVYVGNGTFGLSNPLIIYPNTWLLCSPGAIFTRLNIIQVPFSMIQNFNTGVTPQLGNIRITGGTWNVASQNTPGCMFTLANTQFNLVEDLIIVGQPDGHSPAGRLFGCSNVTLDNIQIASAAPINSGRANQFLPVFQIDELNATNLPGCPTGIYNFQVCVDIRIRGCAHRCGTLSDAFGFYTAWTSFCGSKGTIVSGNIHSNITITECFGTGFAISVIEVINWSSVTCSSNFFTFPKNPYVTTWIGISAQLQTFIFETNSPRCYPPTTLALCTNTVTETIVAQFTVPGNDWRPGTSCYRHRHSGRHDSDGSQTDTLTINLRVGTTGTIADTLVETITVTVRTSQTDIPYHWEHRGFDIDGAGNWRSCGFRALSQAYTVVVNETISATYFAPTPGVQLFISYTATWGHSRSTERCEGKGGHHERVIE